MTPNMISRRTLLAGASGLGVAAIGLTACQPGTEDAEGPAGGAPGEQTPGLQLPTYTPFGDVEPDLPGDAELGLPAAYFHFPEIQEMAGIPLPETEPFSYLAQMPLTQTPQPGNPWYDKFVADMGNRFEMIAGGYAEYLQKFSVTMAGGELPDLVMIEPVPQLERLLDEKFHDLTPYLGGDNIQEYPGLASLPTATWRVCVQGGKLRGVTRPAVPAPAVVNVWSDDMEKLGLEADPAPKDGAELIDMLKAMTSGGSFGLGADPTASSLRMTTQMCGVPNEWRVTDGVFTHAYETEEYLHALEAAGQIWAAEVMHPESITNPDAKSGWFREGVSRAIFQGFAAWGYTTTNAKTRRLGQLVLPKWDGGGEAPLHRGSSGYYSYTAIPKSVSEDRLRELLKIMDYIAAPFGTRQYLTGEYGVEGVHYTLDGNDPVQINEARRRDMIGGLGYAGRQSLFNIYIPGYDDVASRMHAYAAATLPTSVPDPSEGLYSETWSTKGASFATKVKDLQLAIIRGLRPVTAWSDFITSEWTPTVGDKSREEYQAAYEASDS